jgi:sirohydrochlorin ferrochelatase
LARAVAGEAAGLVFPLFMAGGWFTRNLIPSRLAEAGTAGWQMLEPFGCDPAVQDLAVSIAVEAGAGRLLLAAHGSLKSPVPGRIAQGVAERIALATGRPAEAAFIDQPPRIETVQRYGPDSICLPFFAMAGAHVAQDIPAALQKAGFRGRVLPALGLHSEVPGLIARAIAAGVPVCAGACRWA